MIGLLYALPNTQLTHRLETENRLFHYHSKSVTDDDIDQMTSGLNFLTGTPRIEILNNYTRIIESVFSPSNYYKRVVYAGLNVKTDYKHKPGFKTWLIYMRSFLRVCKKAGFSKSTGYLYWKMFFTVIFRNPKGIEPAVNLAAMFIHFHKQKEYVVSVTSQIISDIENIGDNTFNEKMLRKE